ncbi:GPI-anchored surface protein, putative [Bodo saltans]|uniref:GPI-anchored surface protein, putative n=1 Tax=Bodo saltans TaxID=75058 RepID=A0A0S4J073_BODSA|nr:GPI-anchored surface protein, putative [Bodo saltans]|eukprot:CUG32393.1 GPI-anchored surface protein, putative [Bodo saltans]
MNSRAAKAVILLLAFSAVATAIKVDPIVWSTPLNDNNVTFEDSQWIATSPSGAVIVVSGTNLTSLDPHTGAILWSNTHKNINVTYAAFAVSSTAVVIASGIKVTGFNLTNGALLGTAEVTGRNYPGKDIRGIILHRELFVVYGYEALAVFNSDFIEVYAIEKVRHDKRFKVDSIGANEEFIYFATCDDDTGDWNLRILNINNGFSETVVGNINSASSIGVNGYIAIMLATPNEIAVGLLKLSTGTIAWTQSVTVEGATYVTLSSDLVIVAYFDVSSSTIYAYDFQTGSLVFDFATPHYVSSFSVTSGRLVFCAQSNLNLAQYTFVSLDLATGTPLGNVTVPNYDPPTSKVIGTNLLVLNGQGFTCVNVLTMSPVSHQLELPGVQSLASAFMSNGSTTVVFAGSFGAAAVAINN